MHADSLKCCCLTHSSIQVCKLGCSQILPDWIFVKKQKKTNSLGIAVLTVKAIDFNSAVTCTMKAAISRGLYMQQPHGIFLWVFIQRIRSYQTAMTDIYTLKPLRSLSSRQKNNKTKPNKQGKCKLKLCDLPLCTQSGR